MSNTFRYGRSRRARNSSTACRSSSDRVDGEEERQAVEEFLARLLRP